MSKNRRNFTPQQKADIEAASQRQCPCQFAGRGVVHSANSNLSMGYNGG